MKHVTLWIVSGGQSGVDRAALDVAVAQKIPYAGWCPRGGLATDYQKPPGLLEKYPKLRETPAVEVEQRTAWNVRDSNATLLILPEISPGTNFARICAELIFERPCHVAEQVSVHPNAALESATRWLDSTLGAFALSLHPERDPGPVAFTLNIGGPREPERRGVYDLAYSFLDKLLTPFAASDH